MGDFKKRGGFGGNRNGGKFRGGRSSGRPGNRDFRDSQMHSAVCAECGKNCGVPFRPTGDKPVYCSYCFTKHKEDGGDHGRRENFSNDRPRRDDSRNNSFGNKNFSNERPRPQADNGMVQDLKKQIETISNKLDRVIEILKKADSQEFKKIPENKVDIKALSSAVKKAVTAPKSVVAKKTVKVATKAKKLVKKGKK